jgi:hypothetical protein
MSILRTTILSTVAGVALAVSSYAEMTTETRETTTTTTSSGTVSEVSPSSSTIVLKSEGAPEQRRYVYNSHTAWIDSEGNTVSVDTVRNQPVTIYYEQNGDQLVVTRVVSRKPAQGDRAKDHDDHDGRGRGRETEDTS